MKRAAFLLAMIVMTACCFIAWDATKDTVLKDESVSNEIIKDDLPKQSEKVTGVKQEEDDTSKEQEEIETSNSQRLLNQNGLYAFSRLNTHEQNIYVDILSALLAFEDNITLATKEVEEIDKAFQCVLLDHPEIFYVDGYKYTKYTSEDEIKRITFAGNYMYDRQTAEERQEIIENEIERIKNGISKDASDYEKVKYVYETIINETKYDLNAPDNQNICSVFLYKSSVCQGYAKAMQYILNQMDVITTLVIGTVKDGEGHAWDMVLIDGEYYYVDPTWGDAYYLLSSQDLQTTGDKTPSINYDYLCVTTEQISNTHSINNIVELPECNSMKANYYVMEGAYFTEYNESMLQDLFEEAQANSKEAVTLKCSSQSVYHTMLEELIDNQKVFSFLPDIKGTVAYTNCEEQRSISFWL